MEPALCCQSIQEAEIVDVLVGEYDVPRPKLHADLAAMAHRLLDKGLIAATPQ